MLDAGTPAGVNSRSAVALERTVLWCCRLYLFKVFRWFNCEAKHRRKNKRLTGFLRLSPWPRGREPAQCKRPAGASPRHEAQSRRTAKHALTYSTPPNDLSADLLAWRDGNFPSAEYGRLRNLQLNRYVKTE